MHDPIDQQQLERDVRVGSQEFEHHRLQVQSPETHGRGQRQRALGRAVFAGGGLLRFLQLLQDPFTADEEALADLGQHDLACRTVQELHAHRPLEVDDPAVDGRQRSTELARRSRKSPRFRHGDERRHGFEPVHSLSFFGIRFPIYTIYSR